VSTGLFSIVRAVPADHTDPEGTLPLQFDFTERPIHSLSFGAAYSTDLGVMLSAGWSDHNLFGNGEQLNLTAGLQGGGTAVVRPGYNANAQFIKPDFLARDQSLQVDLGAVKQSLLSYDQKAVLFDVLLNRKFSPHWSGSIGVAAEQEHITQEGVARDYTLLGLPITLKYDSSNSVLDPTSGIRALASVTPTQSLGHSEATFLITQLSGSTYLDFGTSGRSVLALRGLVGDAAGASQFQLPPDKRFYAGGTGTVRGFKYQSLGPEFPDGNPEGGTSVVAGTVEFRQRILSSYGAVAFVDAGQVTANGGPFTGSYGVGVGVGARYYTPIGPIRVDVAVPLVKQPGAGTFELYIGIGQAF
jgi:translocation and assembly module TamA